MARNKDDKNTITNRVKRIWKILSTLAITYTIIFILLMVYYLFSTFDIKYTIQESLFSKGYIIYSVSIFYFIHGLAMMYSNKIYLDSFIVASINLIFFIVFRKYYIIFCILLFILKLLDRWLDLI